MIVDILIALQCATSVGIAYYDVKSKMIPIILVALNWASICCLMLEFKLVPQLILVNLVAILVMFLEVNIDSVYIAFHLLTLPQLEPLEKLFILSGLIGITIGLSAATKGNKSTKIPFMTFLAPISSIVLILLWR